MRQSCILALAFANGFAAWLAQPLAAKSPEEKRPVPKGVGAHQRALALLDTGEQSTVLIDVFYAQGG